MNKEERLEYVNYRVRSARETLEAAKLLAEKEFWNSTVNRLYYALFYAVNALLVLNKVQTKSHSSTKSQFSNLFVKTGKFDKKYGRLLSELFDWRQKSDYDTVFDFNSDSVRPLFEPVQEMIDLIEKEIKSSIH
ncbi:MAG: HEPN domain-containing protein [Cyclobacteriaceae bacterium]|nr:HEPN domain-containing protein [Cyclobacteriaceae bacterium]